MVANAEVAGDAEHPLIGAHTDATAPVDVAVVTDVSDTPSPPSGGSGGAGEPISAPDAPEPPTASPVRATSTTTLKWSARVALAFALPIAGVILLAPVVAAIVVVIVAAVTDVLAALNVARLLLQGHLLQAGQAMNVILSASRLGFLALGYLGLFTALIALADGLLGRGRGRLFIIPGIILTGSALILFATSVVLATPLLTSLHLSHRTLAALALVFAVNAVAIATFLADTRDTRRRWIRLPIPHQPQDKTQPPTDASSSEAQ